MYENKVTKQGVMSHQTKDILFSNNLNPYWGSHWETLRTTFKDGVKHYVSDCFSDKAWCFASFPKVKNLQWEWHSHPNALWSGILYISLPKDKEGNYCFTTEFLQEDGKSVFVEPKIGSWFLFPSNVVHRNGFWDYESMSETRLCIAASALKSEQISN